MRSSEAAVALIASVSFLAQGCVSGPIDALPPESGAREDRGIGWSGTGDRIAFQHGSRGVFLSDRDGTLRALTGPDVSERATMPPVFSPDGTLVLYAVVRAAEDDERADALDVEPTPPEGRWLASRSFGGTAYTLYLASADGGAPRTLLVARCQGPASVGTGRVACWHPDGRGVLHLDLDDAGRERVHVRALDAHSSTPIGPAGSTVSFGCSPDGQWLACQVAEPPGLFVQSFAGLDQAWTFFPTVGAATQAPSWRPGSSQVALVCARGRGEVREVWLQDVVAHTSRRLARSPGIRDLRWHPAGARLGWIGSDDRIAFKDADAPGDGTAGWPLGLGRAVLAPAFLTWPWTLPLASGALGASTLQGPWPADAFPGWSSDGAHFAVVTHAGRGVAHRGAYLRAAPERRNRLLIYRDCGWLPTKILLDGMRLTFARWSPVRPAVSLWASLPADPGLEMGAFAPSVLGDPALVVDVLSGDARWMPIDTEERAVVGHLLQLAGDYSGAWERYREAGEAVRPHHRAGASMDAFLTDRLARVDPLLRAVCAWRVGRADDAAALLRRFLATANQVSVAVGGEGSSEAALVAALAPGRVVPVVMRDLLAVEGLLAIRAPRELDHYLTDRLEAAATEEERLGVCIVQAEAALVCGDANRYLDLVLTQLLPRARALCSGSSDDGTPHSDVARELAVHLVAAEVAPLVSDVGVRAAIDAQRLESALETWMRDGATHPVLDGVCARALAAVRREGAREAP